MRDIGEDDRLAEKLEQIGRDEDVAYLGYNCLGLMNNLYPALLERFHDNWYRTWIWENEKGEKIATWDQGNGWCSYMCEGTEEALIAYFESKEKEEVNQPIYTPDQLPF